MFRSFHEYADIMSDYGMRKLTIFPLDLHDGTRTGWCSYYWMISVPSNFGSGLTVLTGKDQEGVQQQKKDYIKHRTLIDDIRSDLKY